MHKDPIIANQWKLAISQHFVVAKSLEKIEKGLICAEHFETSAFKRKNKSELKKGAIPSIFKAVSPITIATSTTVSSALTAATTSANIPVATDATDEPNIDTICIDCERKNDIIVYQRKLIEDLRAKVKRLNDRKNYLGKAKEQISASLQKIKQEKLVDDNLFRQLQVKTILLECLFHFIIWIDLILDHTR